MRGKIVDFSLIVNITVAYLSASYLIFPSWSRSTSIIVIGK